MYCKLFEIIAAVTRGMFTEDIARILCNILLDIVEHTDEEFADSLLSIVASNDRFDIDHLV